MSTRPPAELAKALREGMLFTAKDGTTPSDWISNALMLMEEVAESLEGSAAPTPRPSVENEHAPPTTSPTHVCAACGDNPGSSPLMVCRECWESSVTADRDRLAAENEALLDREYCPRCSCAICEVGGLPAPAATEETQS